MRDLYIDLAFSLFLSVCIGALVYLEFGRFGLGAIAQVITLVILAVLNRIHDEIRKIKQRPE